VTGKSSEPRHPFLSHVFIGVHRCSSVVKSYSASDFSGFNTETTEDRLPMQFQENSQKPTEYQTGAFKRKSLGTTDEHR